MDFVDQINYKLDKKFNTPEINVRIIRMATTSDFELRATKYTSTGVIVSRLLYKYEDLQKESDQGIVDDAGILVRGLRNCK